MKTNGIPDQEPLLSRVVADELPDFLRKNMDLLLSEPRHFAEFMRAKFKEKGVLQQNVFLAAYISENYGYK